MKTQVQTQESMKKSRARWHTCNGCSAGEKERISHWPDRLGYLVSSRLMNKSVSKTRQLLSKGTGGCPLTSTLTRSCTLHVSQLHTHTHIRKTNQQANSVFLSVSWPNLHHLQSPFRHCAGELKRPLGCFITVYLAQKKADYSMNSL